VSETERELIALSLLSAGEAAHAWSAFNPSAFTIRNWVLDGDPQKVQQNIANLRSGYLPAIAFGVGLGAVVSLIARSPLPAAFAGLTSLLMLVLYEQALPAEKRLLSGRKTDTPALPSNVVRFRGSTGL